MQAAQLAAPACDPAAEAAPGVSAAQARDAARAQRADCAGPAAEQEAAPARAEAAGREADGAGAGAGGCPPRPPPPRRPARRMTRAFLARHGPTDAPAQAASHDGRLTEAAGGPEAAGADPAANAPAGQPGAAATAEPGVGAAAPSCASPAPAAPQHGAAVPRPSAGGAAVGAAAQGAQRGSARPGPPACREAAVEDGGGLADASVDCPSEQPAADAARDSGGAEPGQAAMRPEPDQAQRPRGAAGKRRRTLAARAMPQGAPAEPDQAPGAGAGRAVPPPAAGRAPEGIAEAGGGQENLPPPTAAPSPKLGRSSGTKPALAKCARHVFGEAMRSVVHVVRYLSGERASLACRPAIVSDTYAVLHGVLARVSAWRTSCSRGS